MKKTLAILLILLNSFIYAKSFSFQNDSITGSVTYNETAFPGDAIFVKLNLRLNSKSSKKQKLNNTKAILYLYENKKQIGHSSFYFINAKNKRNNNAVLLSGIPLSTWLSSQNEYSIKVVIDTELDTIKEINLPFTVENYTFTEESITFDEKNTKIKQDNSIERFKQIDKLNSILNTTIINDIHSLKPFIKPIDSERMTAFFGDRRTYIYSDLKKSTTIHNGNDYGIPEGTNVISCADGKVVLAENRITTGYSVVIEHLPGLYSIYYHLSKLNVKEGQNINQGSLIGYSGSTGLATGPHLHWEVRLNSCAVRPDFFMQDFTHSKVEK